MATVLGSAANFHKARRTAAATARRDEFPWRLRRGKSAVVAAGSSHCRINASTASNRASTWTSSGAAGPCKRTPACAAGAVASCVGGAMFRRGKGSALPNPKGAKLDAESDRTSSRAYVKTTAAPAIYALRRSTAARRSDHAGCTGPTRRLLAHWERRPAGQVRAARQDARRRVVTRRYTIIDDFNLADRNASRRHLQPQPRYIRVV